MESLQYGDDWCKLWEMMSSLEEKTEKKKRPGQWRWQRSPHLMNKCDSHSPNAGISKYKSLSPV